MRENTFSDLSEFYAVISSSPRGLAQRAIDATSSVASR